MGKGHYLGGGTLGGFGSISNAKGRTGGIGTAGAALREQRRVAEKKAKRELAAKIRVNEKIAQQLGKQWAAEKGLAHYDKLTRVRTC